MQPKTAMESYIPFSAFCCLLATNLHHNTFEFVLYYMYGNLINILFSRVLQSFLYMLEEILLIWIVEDKDILRTLKEVD